MRCVLTTEIPVSRVAVFAEMAWMVQRPELGMLCRTAREYDNRITQSVVLCALPGLSDAGANNVRDWCRMLGLCDEFGGLTALGAVVAETDEAPVPEQGVYCLWLAQHPVIGGRVLAVERLSSNRDQRFDFIEPLPVDPDLRKVFRSVLDAKERFMVRDLPTNHGQPGAIKGETHSTCRLRWTLDFDQAQDQWLLEGKIEAPQSHGKQSMLPMKLEPESVGLDLWNLASMWANGPLYSFGRWQADNRRLAVVFDGLTADEFNTFQKNYFLHQVEIPGKGVFENVTLEYVPIGPAVAKDAQKWAMARFDHHLSAKPGYRSRTEVRELFAQLTEDTPLEAFPPTLPSHTDLLVQASTDPERFWSLAAPVDLSPLPLAATDLGKLQIGSKETIAPTELPGVVRLPYRGGWSMRKLVDHLLSGISPQRVLLCDRYVRGDDNLKMLQIFVAALRASSPKVVVDVWTEVDGDEKKKIQAITGAPVRSYREKFGRRPPHDRYLLLYHNPGKGFGWHMSNSPLHARSDIENTGPETPLRWKDLAANQVSADDLDPELRQWLTGGDR